MSRGRADASPAIIGNHTLRKPGFSTHASPLERETSEVSGASPEEVARTLDFLQAARRPVIFIGHGVTLPLPQVVNAQ